METIGNQREPKNPGCSQSLRALKITLQTIVETPLNELVAIRAAVYFCRSMGKHPSRRLVDTLIRATASRSVRGTKIDSLIRQVVAENGTVPNTSGHNGTQKPLVPDSCGTQPDQTGRTRENSKEGDYVAKATPSPSAKRKRSQPRQVRLDTRSVPETVADDVIAQLRPVIEPVLVGQTWTTWKTRNRKYAVDMARADLTANEIVAAHEDESAQLGEPIRMLSFLQSRLNGENPRSYGDPFANDPPTREDQLPWLSDLIDAGIVE